MRKLYSGIVLNGDKLLESNSNRIELEYYKISTRNVNNTQDKDTYGIEIIKKEYINGNKTEEKENIKYLTDSEKKVNTVLEILSTYEVTPVGLQDVLQEVL